MTESAGTERVAVVTGAASGMGLAISRHLAAAGHPVALLDRQADAAMSAADELREGGGRAIGVEVDVTDRSAVDVALGKVRAELGPVSIMVTAAGVDAFERFAEISIESWERVIAVNLTGTFHCVQAAMPDMREAGWGRVVTISSSSAESGAPRMAHYVASKAGVEGFTRALALEVARKGITVNTVAPGMIDTPMLRRASSGGDIGSLDQTVALAVPMGRAGKPEEIAATCGFLCSEEAGFITGRVFGVSGGMVV